ncbi:hypothetical protein [Mangrovactinospora gilvigrisea]|uniref:hypothetical protein n=1 Tax=Mangrovactinospora gilvigrisea TaxID=1428644 RepID=UPI003AF39D04
MPSQVGRPCVVADPAPGSGSSRARAWSEAITELDRNLPERRENAAALRETLKQYSWDDAAHAMVVDHRPGGYPQRIRVHADPIGDRSTRPWPIGRSPPVRRNPGGVRGLGPPA